MTDVAEENDSKRTPKYGRLRIVQCSKLRFGDEEDALDKELITIALGEK